MAGEVIGPKVGHSPLTVMRDYMDPLTMDPLAYQEPGPGG